MSVQRNGSSTKRTEESEEAPSDGNIIASSSHSLTEKEKLRLSRLEREFPDLSPVELRALLQTELRSVYNSSSNHHGTSSVSNKRSSSGGISCSNGNGTDKIVGNGMGNKQRLSLQSDRPDGPFHKLHHRHREQVSSSITSSISSNESIAKNQKKMNVGLSSDPNDPHEEFGSRSGEGSNPRPQHHGSDGPQPGSVIPTATGTGTASMPAACLNLINPLTGHPEWRLVEGLEQDLRTQLNRDRDRHGGSHHRPRIRSVVLQREPTTQSLGMTVRGTTVASVVGDPAMSASVEVGDRILGVNGRAEPEIVHRMLHASSDPIVLHLLADETTTHVSSSLSPPKSIPNPQTQSQPQQPSSNRSGRRKSSSVADVHPFARALAKRKLLQSSSDESIVTMQLNGYTARARQWETMAYFHVDRTNPDKLLHPLSMRSDAKTKHHNIFTPSTPPFELDDADFHSEGQLIPLAGIRKSLSVRMVNAFRDGNRTAYTLWVYDVELGREWYAPVRYYRDFKDLRTETSRLCPAIARLPFPPDDSYTGTNWFRSSSGSGAGMSGNLDGSGLERFLRTVCTLVYTGPIHPRLQEVAVHLQSFLGCDSVLDGTEKGSVVFGRFIAVNASGFLRSRRSHGHKIKDMALLLLLKRAVQRYVARVCLLPIVVQLMDQLLNALRHNDHQHRLGRGGGGGGIGSSSDTHYDEIGHHNSGHQQSNQDYARLQERAQTELTKVQQFLDQMQDLLLEGCQDDLHALLRGHKEYAPLLATPNMFATPNDLDAFFRDCVREQIEIEIYVPLRSVLSRHLVHGWRHDDMEMKFKMQELRRRPQSYFKIKTEHRSPSDWDSVCKILNMGVGLGTLPCEKLQAITDGAKEINRLHEEEHSVSAAPSDNKTEGGKSKGKGKGSVTISTTKATKSKTLGADDFLPIFIYCVVRAELERPCALCILLRTLCDPAKKIGETGYYLASFEAAISHIAEMDLSDGDEYYGSNPPLL